MKNYIKQNVLALNQLANTLLNGSADEVLSARAYRANLKNQKVWGWTERFINLIWFWQKDEHGKRNHCQRSYQSEVERRHLPDYYSRLEK